MTPSQEIVIATSNEGKLKEFQFMLASKFQVRSPRDESPKTPPEVIEDGSTYRENALKKAIAYARFYQKPVLADDSGLEVEVLKGAPGLYSARFGGEDLTWPQRWNYLFESIRQSQPSPPAPWKARFIAVLCYLRSPESQPEYFEGVCEGSILAEPKGDKGFGYDPLFHSPDLGKTFGQATQEEKRQASHRARATLAFLNWAKASA